MAAYLAPHITRTAVQALIDKTSKSNDAWRTISRVESVSDHSVKVPVLLGSMAPRLWVGDRTGIFQTAKHVELVPQPYQNGVHIDRMSWINDAAGVIQKDVSQMVDRFYQHRMTLLEAVLLNTLAAYNDFNGESLLANTHAAPVTHTGATQDNLLAGTGVTLATLLVDLQSAITQLRGFEQEDGTVLMSAAPQFVVLCPIALVELFKQVQVAESVAIAYDNYLKGSFQIVSHNFADTNDWYLIDVGNAGARPLIFAEREQVGLTIWDESSYHCELTNHLYFGCDGIYAAGAGAWWTIVKTVNA